MKTNSNMKKIFIPCLLFIAFISNACFQAKPENHTDLKNEGKIDTRIKEIDIWHLGTSSWLIQTENHLIVFDYTENSEIQDLNHGNITDSIIKNKDILVFVSHPHGDHYDQTIFKWEKSAKSIKYIFGWNEKQGENYINLIAGDNLISDSIKIFTAEADHSIDQKNAGVAFLVEVDGFTFYHSGDHGHFRKELIPIYTKSIDSLATKTSNIDIAFVYAKFWDGIYYTSDKLLPKQLFPQHQGLEQYNQFKNEAQIKRPQLNVKCAKLGQHFHYKQEYEK
ncbi:MBL fold metallo-hydrolase [Lentimicrobium sp. S6]|uniref:MBL fold metallo-hydrolase n=1 Tax=Lentimicrobium sp. S6 TaxID=2735872 RepID=UPI00155752D7|nr:MBL fold metallo-hydrolase [Lentimicrobium sp. S6]NPD47275.1 MBL fold metallo-hydrolase [Lentimicrobium sp. S6]